MPTATKTKKQKTKVSTDLVIPQKTLANAIDTVIAAVPGRPSHPILADLLIEINQGFVFITAFDLSIGIRTVFAIEPSNLQRRFCIPAKIAQDIINRLDGDLGLSFDENQLILSTDSAQYKIPIVDAGEFPELPSIAGEPVELPANALLEGLRSTRFATSLDESKGVLRGVKIIGDVDSIELASTDGHRLSVWRGQSVGELDFVLPGKAIDTIIRKWSGETIALRVEDSQVQFDSDNLPITARLLEGQYPNYRQLIPKQFATVATCDRATLTQSLERVGIVAEAKNSIVVLSISDDAIVVSCDAADIGSAREEVECAIDGNGIELAFNVKYLLEGLKAMRCDRIVFHMNSPTSPVVVKPDGEGAMEYLVMPVMQRS